MHRLRQRHVFDNDECDSACHMHCLSIKYSIWSRIDSVDKLRVQRRSHGKRVYNLCSWYVQSTHRLRRMHRLRRRQVLYYDGFYCGSVLLGLCCL